MTDKEPRRLSPEHLLAMKAGRERAKARAAERSRGRPAMRVEAPVVLPKERPAMAQGDMSLEDLIDSLGTGEHLTRETRGNTGNEFEVPLQGRRDGWDYQWFATHVMGQQVDPSYEVQIQRGSWFQVPASHFPQMCPANWQRKTIDRSGMRLYMRPERLSAQARAEARQHAFEQKRDKLAQAQAGDGGRDFAPRVQLDGITTNIGPVAS